MRHLPGALRHSVVLLSVLCLGGCAMSFNTKTLGVPVTMAEPLAQGVAGDTFNVTQKAVHAFWGLATAHEPSLQHALAGQLGQGTAIHNLSIRTHKKVPDVVMTILTLGLISPTSVTYTGIITHGTP